MSEIFLHLAAESSQGFVAMSFMTCVAAGWLVGQLLHNVAEPMPSNRWRWMAGSTLIAGLGVWTTHFIAMLGYRPDIMFNYRGGTTALSALAAILMVGGPLALSPLFASWLLRAGLGAVAGLSIAGVHYIGMAAIFGCAASFEEVPVVLATCIGACCLAVACGIPHHLATPRKMCTLFTIAVFGTHFVAIGGTSLVPLGEQENLSYGHVTLSIFIAGCAFVLLLGCLLTIITAIRSKAQQRTLSASLKTVLDNMSNGIIYFDASGLVRLHNRRYLEIFGFEEGTNLIGRTSEDLVDLRGDRLGWSAERRRQAHKRTETWRAFDRFTSFDHQMDDSRIMQVEIRSVDEGGVVVTFDDVTADRMARHKIAELAFCDPLTKLPNRRALNERMERDFLCEQRFKLLLIDLDRFKSVNDNYGHAVGDRLLVQVAERLTNLAGPEGFVARLGGDELALLIYDGRDRATAVADEVIKVVAVPYRIDDFTVSVGCSIGLCCTSDARDAAELLQFSDVALYESKRHGRGCAIYYTKPMSDELSERVQLEADMRTAIERGEIHLVYQPVLALADNCIIGYEALIRWHHPTLGFIAPTRFIPLAEETGQIVPIGAWVLHEACRQAAGLENDLYVAVNVSAVQFRSPLLLSHITQALAQSGLPARRLEIELTETAIVEDGDKIARTLAAIRRLGVTVAMDDFGTGYSSLAHLRDFPLDRIKVDRSFVATAAADRHSMAVLDGITLIARTLGVAILAEGVETPEQLQLLREIGCDAVQGYLIGRPKKLTEAKPILGDRRLEPVCA